MPDSLRELLNQGYRYALSLCHNASRAGDLLQEGWLALLQANGPREKAYLFRAIRSRYLNQIKRDKLVVMVPLESDYENKLSLERDELSSLADMLELELAKLRPIEREALFLHAAEGYTAAEIGQHTGQARGTVLSLIQRARQKLKAGSASNGRSNMVDIDRAVKVYYQQAQLSEQQLQNLAAMQDEVSATQ